MCPNRYVFVSKSIQFWLTIILGILLPFYAVLGFLKRVEEEPLAETFSKLHTTFRRAHQAPSWKPELALYRSEPCELRMVYVSNQGRLCRNVILNVATTYWGGSSSTFLEA